jgi:DNA-binding transcriptional MerR regulator
MDKEYFASINNVSRELGIPAHTLRYWEKQFPTVVRPVSGVGGRRYYRPETVSRLKTIQDLLYNRGMTIAGVKKLIRNGDFLTGDVEPWSVKKSANVATQEPVTESENFDFNNLQITSSLDATKVDLAIDLLTQARDLLK